MTQKLVLGFDTSAAHCAAALLSGERLIGHAHEPMDKGQAERLLPLLEALMAAAGCNWHDLDLIAVGTGPGNFTGVRIAVAAARGLALALKIPAVGVSTLEALALDLPRPLRVIEDARRGEVYIQSFAAPQSATMACDRPDETATGRARLVPADSEDLFRWTGEAGQSASYTGSAAGPRALPPRYPLAEAIARIATKRPGGQPRPAPFYLRGADAAPPSDPPPVILP
jgi:tRNA threonylcarbamoyladenosine biosynthesis protein TsaB